MLSCTWLLKGKWAKPPQKATETYETRNYAAVHASCGARWAPCRRQHLLASAATSPEVAAQALGRRGRACSCNRPWRLRKRVRKPRRVLRLPRCLPARLLSRLSPARELLPAMPANGPLPCPSEGAQRPMHHAKPLAQCLLHAHCSAISTAVQTMTVTRGLTG